MKNQREVLEELESSFLTGLLNIAYISRTFPCRSWPDRYFRDHKVSDSETTESTNIETAMLSMLLD